jgi:hypothetical protein
MFILPFLPVLVAVKSLSLLDDDEASTDRDGNHENYQSNDKSEQTIGNDEADNRSTDSSCCPVYVSPLKPHKFNGLLESFEQWVFRVLD